jgi:hypothetical protein
MRPSLSRKDKPSASAPFRPDDRLDLWKTVFRPCPQYGQAVFLADPAKMPWRSPWRATAKERGRTVAGRPPNHFGPG